MQQTREQTIGYIIDMVSELQKMADKSGNPVLALLLQMAKLEATNSLKQAVGETDSPNLIKKRHKQSSLV